MATIDEQLFRQQKLASDEEQSRVAGAYRENLAQERLNAANGGQPADQSGTLGQQISAARMAEEAETAATGGGISTAASTGSARLLQLAILNLIDSFGLTLIYINLHVFGHSVLGEKIFCALGEEWIPPNLRSGMSAESFKSKVRTLGLVEKMGLIFLDTLVFIALLFLLIIIISLLNSPLAQAILWLTDQWNNALNFFNL
jgi:hypothetical protein